jgi:hypothetical protein
MIDYTRLRKKLVPEPDGEPATHLRTATVDAVNSDGTVDLLMNSGVVVPDIPKLESANVFSGMNVQVISLRGSLLVIGGVSSSPAPSYPVGDVATSTSTEAVTSEETVATISDFVFRSGWAYAAWCRCAVYGDAAGRLAHFRLRKTNVAGTDWGEFGRMEVVGTGAGQGIQVNAMIPLIRSATTDLTATVVLTASASAGTVNLWAGTNSPRYLMLTPLGPASQYAGAGVEVS